MALAVDLPYGDCWERPKGRCSEATLGGCSWEGVCILFLLVELGQERRPNQQTRAHRVTAVLALAADAAVEADVAGRIGRAVADMAGRGVIASADPFAARKAFDVPGVFGAPEVAGVFGGEGRLAVPALPWAGQSGVVGTEAEAEADGVELAVLLAADLREVPPDHPEGPVAGPALDCAGREAARAFPAGHLVAMASPQELIGIVAAVAAEGQVSLEVDPGIGSAVDLGADRQRGPGEQVFEAQAYFEAQVAPAAGAVDHASHHPEAKGQRNQAEFEEQARDGEEVHYLAVGVVAGEVSARYCSPIHRTPYDR